MAERATGYATVFFLTFLFTGVVGAIAWFFVDGRRKAAAGPQPSSILRSEVLSTISLFEPVLERIGLAKLLRKLLDEAGLDWSVGRTILLMLTIGAVTLNLLLYFGIPVALSCLAACATASTPVAVIRQRRSRQLRRVEDQLPEALDYLSRALLAGHSLPASLELLADECEPPLSTELRKTVDEYNLGLSLEDAFHNLMLRLPSMDIQFFVSAIQTQSRSGGSLHELLEDLAETIRERMTLKRHVRAVTANGRMTAIVLSALPFAVAGTMLYINPQYFDLLLQHRSGPTMLGLAVCGQVAAFFVIRRIVNIKI